MTVLIPAYNAERYIAQAVESVLAQTLTDFELLVIDDGSTDATPSILERYARDPRLRLVRHSVNEGAPRRRNQGVRLARGSYFAMMDADDYCTRDRLAAQVAYLDTHRSIDVLACMYFLADGQGRTLPPDRLRQFLTPDEIAANMLFFCPVHHSTLMARTHVIAAYQYDEDFPVAQDYELWSRMIKRHRFAVLPQRLMFYRQHTAQATSERSLVRKKSHSVQARQLAALGLEFSKEDVVNHDLLARFKGRGVFKAQSGRELDLDFVVWARRWIAALLQANRVHELYPEPEFSQILGSCWLLLCRKAAGGAGGMAVWREFAGSPLKRIVAGSVIRKYAAWPQKMARQGYSKVSSPAD